MDCIFCRILAKKASGSLVFEDGLAAAFLDIHPVTEGHLLIVPKMHVERFSKLPDEVAAHLFKMAREVLAALEVSGIPCEGANLFLSDGTVAGQEVPHAHLHIAPRHRGDGQRMGFVHMDAEEWPRPRLDAVAAKIREALEGNRGELKRAVPVIVEQPVLETQRLRLRAYTPADVDDVFVYASAPEVARFVPWHHHKTLEDSFAFLEYAERSRSFDRDRLFYVFAMEEIATGRVIGSIDFKKINPRMGQIDYASGKASWGKGYMSEAAIAIRDWAFRTLPELDRIQAYCVSQNRGSSRVMEKAGMKKEGRRELAFLLKGESVDLDDYAILRRDWKEQT